MRRIAVLTILCAALLVGPAVAGLIWPEVSEAAAALIIVATTAVALLALFFANFVAATHRRIVDATGRLARGEMNSRIQQGGGELVDNFNRMAAGLENVIAAASQERNRLVAALNSSVDAVVAVDSDGRVTFANTSADRLFARGHDALVGNPFVWLLPNEEVLDRIRSSREEGTRSNVLVERPNRQYLEVFITPILAGGDWSALVVFHDLTEIKRVEKVRRDFVANVSHELRTPLASIKAVIETLQEGALEEEIVARDFLARADVEVDRLVAMVEELLELSRIESGEVPMARESVDMGAMLHRAVERLGPQAERQGIALTVNVAPGLPLIEGDPERLERAAVNLIHNAIKFTADGGSIEASTRRENNTIILRVTDSGAGIAPEDQPRVFERFYKVDHARQSEGSGLGLAVVKHTVEAHGGTVSIQSEQGRGSTFTIALPVATSGEQH